MMNPSLNIILFSYQKIAQQANEHRLIAIVILGLVFAMLGWIISRLMRPNLKQIQIELNHVKRELLDELNTSKKFNADYQLLVRSEDEKKENA